MITLLKSIADFLEPIGLIWLLLTWMTLRALWKKNKRSALLPGFAWMILTVLSVLPVPHLLLASLEDDWPPVELAALPECDAIMVLGGGMEPSLKEPAGIHLHVGADRLFTALMLARMGKGKSLVIGGGIFKRDDGSEVSEAEGVLQWLREWDLTRVPVLSLGGCRDTHDEALKVAALVKERGWQRIALVTSAYHMRRTQAVFAKAGAPVLPVPCNYQSAQMRGRPLHWISAPNATHLLHFETWMHEKIGWWVYRLRGWI